MHMMGGGAGILATTRTLYPITSIKARLLATYRTLMLGSVLE